MAWFAEILPNPLVTRNQVALMQVDNISSPHIPGFEELGISPHSVSRCCGAKELVLVELGPN